MSRNIEWQAQLHGTGIGKSQHLQGCLFWPDRIAKLNRGSRETHKLESDRGGDRMKAANPGVMSTFADASNSTTEPYPYNQLMEPWSRPRFHIAGIIPEQ